MRRLIRPLYSMLLFCWFFGFRQESRFAKAAYARPGRRSGQNYEQRRIFQAAYDQSRRNSAIAPRLSGPFLAASSEVHRGQILRDAGKFTKPSPVQKALETDLPLHRAENSAARSR